MNACIPKQLDRFRRPVEMLKKILLFIVSGYGFSMQNTLLNFFIFTNYFFNYTQIAVRLGYDYVLIDKYN